jgi:hypothetical protein
MAPFGAFELGPRNPTVYAELLRVDKLVPRPKLEYEVVTREKAFSLDRYDALAEIGVSSMSNPCFRRAGRERISS